MGDSGENTSMQPSISSREHEELLDLIDKIRSNGISRFIDIPQIVVCGDQSSGKSSTVEALCGHKFPTGDGLCTRFATEFILRRDKKAKIIISIVPDSDRTDQEKKKLEAFQPALVDLNDFQSIVDKAALEMGLGKTKNFAHDVLRIEIFGPDKTPLTLVDLPGLFHSETKEQKENDKKAVYDLVGNYISKSRSIILAVVSAKNDVTNQVVLNFAQKHDPQGDRTLGIITKPDRIETPKGETDFFDLVQNKNIKLALGWHVVKNRSYEERDFSPEQRDKSEASWLGKGVWEMVDAKHKGVSSLRVKLSKILQSHIHSELPAFVKEVGAGIADCENKFRTLGSSRATLEEQRLYLLQASQTFSKLVVSAASGPYSDAFFGSSATPEGFAKRLCATAALRMKEFENDMRLKGHAIQLVDYEPNPLSPDEAFTLPEARIPLKVNKEKFYKEVEHRMDRNSGRELPGYPSSEIIRDLFFEQASRWLGLIEETKRDILTATQTTVSYILEHVADEATISGIRRHIINPNMEPLAKGLEVEVAKIMYPFTKGTPKTHNHYFTDLVQQAREGESQKDLGKRMLGFLGVNPLAKNQTQRMVSHSFDAGKLLEALTGRAEADMGRLGAIENVNGMLALYKVTPTLDAAGINKRLTRTDTIEDDHRRIQYVCHRDLLT